MFSVIFMFIMTCWYLVRGCSIPDILCFLLCVGIESGDVRSRTILGFICTLLNVYEFFFINVVMDRSWITTSRISDEYENSVEEFIQFAKRNGVRVNNKYYCPCVNCVNVIRQDIELIREHILCDGFLKSYTIWTWHGEVLE